MRIGTTPRPLFSVVVGMSWKPSMRERRPGQDAYASSKNSKPAPYPTGDGGEGGSGGGEGCSNLACTGQHRYDALSLFPEHPTEVNLKPVSTLLTPQSMLCLSKYCMGNVEPS